MARSARRCDSPRPRWPRVSGEVRHPMLLEGSGDVVGQLDGDPHDDSILTLTRRGREIHGFSLLLRFSKRRRVALRNERNGIGRSGAARRLSTRPAQLPSSRRLSLASSAFAFGRAGDADEGGLAATSIDAGISPQVTQRVPTRHTLASAPVCPPVCPNSVRDPINRQPTPTKLPMKNGPEIIDFRPVL